VDDDGDDDDTVCSIRLPFLYLIVLYVYFYMMKCCNVYIESVVMEYSVVNSCMLCNVHRDHGCSQGFCNWVGACVGSAF